MNVHRFAAPNNQKALALVHKAFGSEALIYSTHSTEFGVEIIAGPAFEEEIIENKTVAQNADFAMIEKLHSQLQVISETVERLTLQVNQTTQQEMNYADDEQIIKRNLLNFHLNKMGFKGKFAQQFMTNYLRSKKLSEAINEENIATSMLKYIKTNELEILDEHNICAFIGPTGVGKTTTLMKLAKRYLTNHDVKSLGLITTDYNDISGRNQLLNFSRLYNIDLEFANDANEMTIVLEAMKQKKMILIDTHGISQRDHQQVSQLLELLESQGNKIAAFMILPCNVQEPILDEIARAFQTKNLQGCIFTKQDESISTAPVLSISISYKMKIAYICNGQDIDTDIHLAIPESILHHIVSESATQKKMIEEQLIKNVERVTRKVTPELRLG